MEDLLDGLLGRPGALIRAIVIERVVDIRDRHDPAAQRDLLPRERAGVARAVPTLVMRQRNLLRRTQEMRLAAGQNPSPDDRVALHRLELVRCQPARLE
jgi:hypothetical protein